MNFLNSANKTEKFKNALQKTLADFEKIPAKDLFARGKENSFGVVSGFIYACANGHNHRKVIMDFNQPVPTLRHQISFETKVRKTFLNKQVSASSPFYSMEDKATSRSVFLDSCIAAAA